MVKLAQTIGASSIAQSTRMPMNMGSHVIEVRQNLYSDTQEKDAVRVFPFTDIQYAGAEVAGTNSVIASCLVPIIASVDVQYEQGYNALSPPPQIKLDNLRSLTKGDYIKWMRTGFGMVDYIFGISQRRSYKSAAKAGFNGARHDLYEDARGKGSIDGTAPVEIRQFLSEDEALDEISTFPAKMIIGFVLGPRDVKLYYTETAIGMMARRMRRVVESLGPCKPQYYPIGLGHLSVDNNGTPWKPNVGRRSYVAPKVTAPTTLWDAGGVQYKARALKAAGSMYIPWDQVPYGTMRRNFKYNHIMTQTGLEMLETLQAIGISMDSNLDGNRVTDFVENGTGVQVAALQMLYSSMFGVSSATSTTNDFAIDAASAASGIKDKLGFLFNSGHIHIDPGVFSYFTDSEDGYLSTAINHNLKYKGRNVSPATLYREFIAKYVVWGLCASAMESYFTVPLYQCHWLYVGSPKPEYVTEQLQMNFRSDVYFDGDNSLPFTLIPSRLNPGEIISRVPCLMNLKANEGNVAIKANKYLGVRDPLPYGSVQDIRFSGDKPLTTVEERDYTFTPIIEADAHTQSQYRNSRTVNCAVWPRPTHYSPGATRLGAVYGMLSDNASVGGHYYYQPLNGVLVNDGVDQKIFRSMAARTREDAAVEKQLLAGFTDDDQQDQQDYWDKHSIDEKDNPQEGYPRSISTVEPKDADQVFPVLTSEGS